MNILRRQITNTIRHVQSSRTGGNKKDQLCRSTPELNSKAQALLAQGGNIHFAAFAGGTLPMEKSQPQHKGAALLGTWRVAYAIDTIRDWLLAQRRQK